MKEDEEGAHKAEQEEVEQGEFSDSGGMEVYASRSIT